MKVLLSAVLFYLLIPGCASVSQNSATSTPPLVNPELTMMAVTDAEEQSPDRRTTVLNKIFQEEPLYLAINEVSVKPGEVAIAISVENRSERRIRFYPSQGRLRVGTTEIEANLFLSDLNLSRSFAPDEKRSGALVFKSHLSSELSSAQPNNIRLILGQVIGIESSNPGYVDIPLSPAP